MHTAIPVNLKRISLDVRQMVALVQRFAPDVAETRIRAWQGRGILRAGATRPVHFGAVEALRALVFVACQTAFGTDSPIPPAIVEQVSVDDLHLLASDTSPDPSVTVSLPKCTYQIIVNRSALDDVIGQLEAML